MSVARSSVRSWTTREGYPSGASVTATNTATASRANDDLETHRAATRSPIYRRVLRGRGVAVGISDGSFAAAFASLSAAKSLSISRSGVLSWPRHHRLRPAAPVVDTVSAALGTVVEQKQIAELPLVDRSYARLIVLAPGANEVPTAAAGLFQQFFGRQPQYTVSGARPGGQVFLLDNTNVQNYWNRGSGSGQLGTTLGVDAIAEFRC